MFQTEPNTTDIKNPDGEKHMHMPKLAHAYVPFQILSEVYPPMKGLEKGTIFSELDMPYFNSPDYEEME